METKVDYLKRSTKLIDQSKKNDLNYWIRNESKDITINFIKVLYYEWLFANQLEDT
jgi:hypothetical protein